MTDIVLMPVSPKTEAGAIAALNRETEENGLTSLATAKSEQLLGGILEAST